MTELRTPRLILRRWREEDRPPFAAMNADTRVMEHFPGVMSAEESNAFVDRIEQIFATQGYGLWATEVIDGPPFIGFVGLWIPNFEAHFTPAVEIGWRLAADRWGMGFATEGARAVADHAFDTVGLAELVSMTIPANVRSRRVMENLGMQRDPAEDFDHPRFPDGHRLRRHVLYRLSADEWRATRS